MYNVPKLVDMRGKLTSRGNYGKTSQAAKTHIVIHHSLTKTGSAEAYANYHVNTLGWQGIGYQFVIEQDGTVKWCHNMETISYHVGNHNGYCVGICLTGDFRTQKPTNAQRRSMYLLVNELKRKHPSLKTVTGHSDLKGYEWKECPVFDYKRVLNEEAQGIGGGTSNLEPQPQPNNDGSIGTITVTGTGVNLRSGAGTNYPVKRKIAPNTYIVWAMQNGWACVGGDEWVYADPSYTTLKLNGQPHQENPKPVVTGVATILGTNVNLRKSPSTSAPIVRKMNKGEPPYKVWAKEGNWLNLGGNQWVYYDPSYIKFVQD
ncbi:N-acetylmuramoyl-L-alanine amidase [Bacillus pacificus]|uniref:N-acetylmuramoyl-L-alanine amidase n=1 Tax=Bacillus pacificus TaxID=2026187 RepID=UPI0039900F7A